MSEEASTLSSPPGEAPSDAPDPQLLGTLRFSWPATWVLILSFSAIGAAIAQVAAGPNASGFFITSLTIVVCLAAAWHDAATSRIPNEITYTAILLGLALNLAGLLLDVARQDLAVRWLGAVGPGQSLGGFALCAGIGLFSLAVAGMGGGDAKLLGALGALLGFNTVSGVLIFALTVAVAYSLINLLIIGRLNHAVRAAALWFLDLVYMARPQKIVAVQRSTIPLAVPLSIGLILSQTPAQRVLAKWLGM